MALIIVGMQGTGVSTFLNRCEYHSVQYDNLNRLHGLVRSYTKNTYQSISGPSEPFESEAEDLAAIAEDYFPMLYDAVYNGTFNFNYKNNPRGVWGFNCPEFAEWVIANRAEDNHTTVVLQISEDLHCQRLYDRERLTDPRLIGKTNAYEMVKHEYLREIRAHADSVNRLTTSADYHIENDGQLNQYYAVIDQVLNECNLLD